MTHVTAQHVAPQMPLELAVMVGTLIEREYRENFPQASPLTFARDTRAMMRQMDPETALDIIGSEFGVGRG